MNDSHRMVTPKPASLNRNLTAFLLYLSSKLTQDNRIESPIPILPLPTPDTETEKLIKMKDEEVRPVSAWASLVLELESGEFLQDCPIETSHSWLPPSWAPGVEDRV